ncbi:MAG: hypothetical protein ABTQ29_10755 [Siculibacillus sp.]
MTPLYDIVSAQPSLDGGQVLRKRMKLAMAVGDNRHTLVDGIATRHFLQSAEMAGLGRDAALAVIDDLVECGPAAVDRIRQDLPAGFPNAIADSITRGVLSQLEQLASGRP